MVVDLVGVPDQFRHCEALDDWCPAGEDLHRGWQIVSQNVVHRVKGVDLDDETRRIAPGPEPQRERQHVQAARHTVGGHPQLEAQGRERLAPVLFLRLAMRVEREAGPRTVP
ncbi:hypothetical protein ACIRQO_36305 [Streptomyces anulatus]